MRLPVSERLAWLAAPQSVRLERAGDAALCLEDYRGTQEGYEKIYGSLLGRRPQEKS
jgi:hypothetical protein